MSQQTQGATPLVAGLPAASEERPSGPLGKLQLFLTSIKFEHTVFALPFAYLSLFLVEGGLPGLWHFVWVTLAMAGARTCAMGANRLIDAEIDARNPRTALRPIPAGLLSKAETLAFTLAGLGLFLGAASQLAGLAFALSPAVVAAMVVYPYTKRFTPLCHFFIGLVYLMVPTGVWIAVAGELALAPVLLGLGAGLWVTGFDLLYACQDVENDRAYGLHSVPADFGISTGLFLARALHLLTVALVAAAGPLLNVGPLYYIGAAFFLGLLVYEHRLVSPGDLSRLNVAFFTMNGVISVVFFLFVMVDVLVR